MSEDDDEHEGKRFENPHPGPLPSECFPLRQGYGGQVLMGRQGSGLRRVVKRACKFLLAGRD
ncbi:MAG: hypothetical protein JWR19_4566 [Pedosphaera sp.]|nr:hypothetical protein [Pedosphaera sp.]